jgi:molybdopterin-containing oxidoreductase family iron-sulfur binding subunit
MDSTRVDDLHPTEATPTGRRISRRALLGSAAVIAGGAAAAPLWLHLDELVASVAAADFGVDFGETTRHHWVMVFDLRRCDGCGDCTRACQKTHYLEPDQTWIKVYDMSTAGGRQFFMPRLCMQCADAPCQRVCPVKATFKNRDGVVLINQDTCIGCRLCMSACPYEARYFNWSEPTSLPPAGTTPTPEFPSPQRRGTVGKCTFCVHHTEKGELPSCVSACNMEAVYIGDLDADIATNGAETVRLSTYLADNHAVRYKDELNTGPHVYYILGHGQDLDY